MANRTSLFRISYATSNKALEEACRRIQSFCNSLT
jgi:aspartate/methionine/tyrosine aminotransferase